MARLNSEYRGDEYLQLGREIAAGHLRRGGHKARAQELVKVERNAPVEIRQASDDGQESDWHGSDDTSSTCDADYADVPVTKSATRKGTDPCKLLCRQRKAAQPRLEIIDLTSPTKSPKKPSKSQVDLSRAMPTTTTAFQSLTIADSNLFMKAKFPPPHVRTCLQSTTTSSAVTPPESPTKSKLNSPKKSRRIPPTPHRPSIDAFWSQEVMNEWIDDYSPQKTVRSPRKTSNGADSDDKGYSSPSTPPRKSPQKSLVKKSRTAVQARKTFEQQKRGLAEAFLQELDERIADGRIRQLSASTGGVQIVWSKKLNSTAGRANWRREGVKSRDESGAITTAYRHIALIELAEKVIDDEQRLLNVLAHEYCHLANFMISNVKDKPHGPSFKAWAAKVSQTFANRGVVVTTKHSYEISYRYAWTCVNDMCRTEYARHSKSIDTTRHTCGKCKGRLVQTRPVPRAAVKSANSLEAAEAPKREYQVFVKENFRVVKQELGNTSPMKDVMRELGSRFRLNKEQKMQQVRATVTKEPEIRDLIQLVEDEPEPSSPGEVEDEIEKVARVLDFLTMQGS